MRDLLELRCVQWWVWVAVEEGWKVVVVSVREDGGMCGVVLPLYGGQRKQRIGYAQGVVRCAVPRVVNRWWPNGVYADGG